MNERLERIQELFRENPRMWIVVAIALLIGIGAIWISFGGYSFGINKFFATCETGDCDNDGFLNPSVRGNDCNDADPTVGGDPSCRICDVPESAFTCGDGDCDDDGVLNPSVGGGDCNDANWCIGGGCGSTGTPTPTPGTTGTPTPTSTGSNGDCNLVNGLWYCKSLSCGLAGNGSNPPAGPANSIVVAQSRTVCNDVQVSGGPQVGCKVFLEATPKKAGQEGYPPNDPNWTCTGPLQMQETDGWYCYNPFGKPTAPGPVTCCAGTGLSGDCVSFTVKAGVTTTSTPTGTPGSAVLRASCSASSATLTWNIPVGANSNTIQRMVPGGSWVTIFGDASLTKTSYVDGSPVAGTQWRHKSGANVASNVVTCAGTVSTPTPFGSPTPTGTPIVQGPPVQCTPSQQFVGINQTAHLQATGGSNVFTWNITQGGALEEGGNEYIGVSYRTLGQKTLRVSSGGTSAVCRVDVMSDGTSTPTPTPTLSSTPTLSPLSGVTTVEKTAQNITTGDPLERVAITVYPGQSVQFTIRVKNVSTNTLNEVLVTDMVPAGMSYQSGSTTIDGRAFFDNGITTTGVSISPIAPGASVVIRWSAVADRTSEIISGPNQFSPAAHVLVQGALDARSQMSVTVYGTGASAGPSTVPTGPEGTIIAALMAAAALTLLYSGYTRSPSYRRREAADVSKDHPPLDFRS